MSELAARAGHFKPDCGAGQCLAVRLTVRESYEYTRDMCGHMQTCERRMIEILKSQKLLIGSVTKNEARVF